MTDPRAPQEQGHGDEQLPDEPAADEPASDESEALDRRPADQDTVARVGAPEPGRSGPVEAPRTETTPQRGESGASRGGKDSGGGAPAPSPAEPVEAPYVDDPVSKWWVGLIIAVFVIVFAWALFLSDPVEEFLDGPEPTAVPTLPAPSPSPVPSHTATASPVATPRPSPPTTPSPEVPATPAPTTQAAPSPTTGPNDTQQVTPTPTSSAAVASPVG